ncbi:uncharacterized protein EI90DRAFT_3014711 [Cantharellus anzutake]|uniref:uncharacterized protein n=1 Tax=Cantharellus anzutake TaxID=1750568 RepID=UPI001904F384|nr:uncharacterized protein EI90DRAFT_3014711 [Cantharellus anzutake]KAF8335490.1 hypothetical protein EI90DRAFT_3014711 [Cantharellus anzutake]
MGCQLELTDRITAEEASVQRMEEHIRQKEAKLRQTSPSMVTNLESLRHDKWLNFQLNLHILKDQIVSKLHAWKFELANLDHAYHSHMLDQKTQDQAGRAIRHHEPGIMATVKHYNKKWNEMLCMQLAGSTPANAVVPPELNMTVIFDLDVNADIWLDASVEDLGQFPDAAVRHAMQMCSRDPDALYFLGLVEKSLVAVLSDWRKHLTTGPFEWTMLNQMLVSPLVFLPATPSLVVAHLPPSDLDMSPQLQHEVLGIEDGYDSSDDDTANSEAEDIAQEGDFTVIVDLDHATATLGDAGGENGATNGDSDDELQTS